MVSRFSLVLYAVLAGLLLTTVFAADAFAAGVPQRARPEQQEGDPGDGVLNPADLSVESSGAGTDGSRGGHDVPHLLPWYFGCIVPVPGWTAPLSPWQAAFVLTAWRFPASDLQAPVTGVRIRPVSRREGRWHRAP